jgi:DNA-binding NarL/FixJ family response regulator
MPNSLSRDENNLAVCIIEDNPLLLESLLAKLRKADNIRIMSEKTIRSTRLDNTVIILIDRGTLVQNWKLHLHEIRSKLSASRFIVLDNELTAPESLELLQQGVHGFISYQQVSNKFLQAIFAVNKGELWFSRKTLTDHITLTTQSFHRKNHSESGMTARQEQLLGLLKKGSSNKEISVALGISESTVKFHMGKVFSKLGIHDRRSILIDHRTSKEDTRHTFTARPGGFFAD